MIDALLVFIIFGFFFGYLALSEYLETKAKQAQLEYEKKLIELENNRTLEKMLQILEKIEKNLNKSK